MVLALVGLSCGQQLVGARRNAETSSSDGDVPAICPVRGDPLNPVIAGLEQGLRSVIQSMVASNRLVVVQIDDGNISILPECTIVAEYIYRASDWATTRCDISSDAEARATLSFGIGSARVSGKAEGKFSLFYGTRGSWILNSQPTVSTSVGPCSPATHYASAISVGAWATVYGARRDIDGNLDVMKLLSGNARLSTNTSVSQKTGTEDACKSATPQPTLDCSAPLAMSLTPIDGDECILEIREDIELRPNSSISLGRCKIVGDVIALLSGGIEAHCNHSAQGYCNSPTNYSLKVSIGGIELPMDKRTGIEPDTSRTHVWAPRRFVAIGSAKITEADDVRLHANICFVENSTDEVCYVRAGTRLIIRAN